MIPYTINAVHEESAQHINIYQSMALVTTQTSHDLFIQSRLSRIIDMLYSRCFSMSRCA